MNINDFRFWGIGLHDMKTDDLLWASRKTSIADIDINLKLPYIKKKFAGQDKFDLRNLHFVSKYWVGAIPVNNDYGKIGLWTAIMQRHGQKRSSLILMLEAYFEPERGKYLIKTPPGRPGSPMTILADIRGEIVPCISMYPGSMVRLFFLSHDWASFGFENLYPAVALQVMEEYQGTTLAMTKHQEYLKRNSRR